jgi:hypothetical protein
VSHKARLACVLIAAPMFAPGQADETKMLPSGIDHLVYAVSDLERGMDEIERLLGVRPVAGGRHPQYGTHNALLSLGSTIYLEIIARDPSLPAPQQGALVDLSPGDPSRLITWVFRPENIEEASAAARDANIGLGPVETGSRERPDGSMLSWQLTDPYAMPMDGALPFLIHWGDTPHPSGAVPLGGNLVELVIEHTRAEVIRDAMSVLGAHVTVRRGDEFRLSAAIETNSGIATLR